MTSDAKTARMPKGIPYIIGNEAAERFSYYGMKTILVIYMTKYLMDTQGQPAPMDETTAKTWFHLFSMANYFFPILGAIVADVFWGKYKTIMNLSIVYCLGNLLLAVMDMPFMLQLGIAPRLSLGIGLALIAIGSGGIKPCVSANVGDQFTEENKGLIERVFSFFYFSINFGAFFSSLFTPLLLDRVGPAVAFGLPGILMFIATVIFWAGSKQFRKMPPVGWETYRNDIWSPAGKKAMGKLSILYLFISVFWALFDQTGSSWVLQADRLDKVVNLGFISFELLPSQIQAINPILVMLLIPIFSFAIYPAFKKLFDLTAVRKMSLGMGLAAFSFALIAMTETRLSTGATVGIIWQFWAYVIITMSEVMVSITALEFSYTQAPNSMKSFIMGLYLLSVSLGNLLTALVNAMIQREDGSLILEGAAYFWFFTILMAVTAIGFAFMGSRYKEEQYLQGA